jgi:hypothetical protein
MTALTVDTEKELKNATAPQQEEPAAGVVGGLKSKSLKAAGVGFLLADAALITSGLMSKDKGIWFAGLCGLSAGAVGTRYGNPKAEKQLELVERRLGQYLKRQGVEIPQNPTTENMTKEGGLLDHIESFLYKYPSQVMNAFYSMIGISFAGTAIGMPKEAGMWQKASLFTSGALLIAGALSGLLIHEKKPDPSNPPQGTLQKAWSWIQEKPLRLTGTLFNANQVFLGLNALEQHRKNPDSYAYIPKLAAVAFFTFGNTMMAMTSKEHGGKGNSMDDATKEKLAESAALVILAQPKQMQDNLLEHVSGYLATEAYVSMSAKDISSMLKKKLEEVRAAHPELQQPMQQSGQKSDWQAKVNDSKGAAVQPSL